MQGNLTDEKTREKIRELLDRARNMDGHGKAVSKGGDSMSYKEAEREEMKEQNDELQDVEQFEMDEDEEEEY